MALAFSLYGKQAIWQILAARVCGGAAPLGREYNRQTKGVKRIPSSE
jgi:hypothetical protein